MATFLTAAFLGAAFLATFLTAAFFGAAFVVAFLAVVFLCSLFVFFEEDLLFLLRVATFSSRTSTSSSDRVETDTGDPASTIFISRG